LIDVKVFILLASLVVGTYAILWVLGQFEWFKKYQDAGTTFAFEAVLGIVALFTGFLGIRFNGYRRGFKDGSS